MIIFDLEDMSWSPAPFDLPVPIYQAASVQYGTTMAVVGGRDNHHYDTMYKLDEDTYEWIEMEQKLSVAKSAMTVISLPNYLDTLCQ